MPKLAVKRDTDYRLSVMIHGEMGAQNVETEIVVVGGVEPEKAAEYAGVSRPTLYNLLKRPTAYFPQTLRLMRALSIPVEEMRAAISYPW